MYSKSYRLYFSSEGYDSMKYKGHVSTPKLITQRDRQFYYRLATKLSDAQIHAAFLQAYFFKPTAYVSDVATPTAAYHGDRPDAMDEPHCVSAWIHPPNSVRPGLDRVLSSGMAHPRNGIVPQRRL